MSLHTVKVAYPSPYSESKGRKSYTRKFRNSSNARRWCEEMVSALAEQNGNMYPVEITADGKSVHYRDIDW